jgi:hypothetical protein
LIDRLVEALSAFNESNTQVRVHLTFQEISVGNVSSLHPAKYEMWWDENLMIFVGQEP